jgi:hypothetical protein
MMMKMMRKKDVRDDIGGSALFKYGDGTRKDRERLER